MSTSERPAGGLEQPSTEPEQDHQRPGSGRQKDEMPRERGHAARPFDRESETGCSSSGTWAKRRSPPASTPSAAGADAHEGPPTDRDGRDRSADQERDHLSMCRRSRSLCVRQPGHIRSSAMVIQVARSSGSRGARTHRAHTMGRAAASSAARSSFIALDPAAGRSRHLLLPARRCVRRRSLSKGARAPLRLSAVPRPTVVKCHPSRAAPPRGVRRHE